MCMVMSGVKHCVPCLLLLPPLRRLCCCRCRQVLSKAGSDAGDVAFCQDYLGDGSPGNPGSCCMKDDEWDAWCSKVRATVLRPGWGQGPYGWAGQLSHAIASSVLYVQPCTSVLVVRASVCHTHFLIMAGEA